MSIDRTVLALLATAASLSCGPAAVDSGLPAGPYLLVLGVAQDGGRPQAGCRRECCRPAAEVRHVSSLGIVDPRNSRRWLIDATPDLGIQIRMLDQAAPVAGSPGLDGIFLTHAHVGHYAGLLHLGREVLGARGVMVHAMPRMDAFLRVNGPWDQLNLLGNIELRPLTDQRTVPLGADLTITPFLVPHRDEYSETVGFRIDGPERSVIYLPDIDKWERWDRSLPEQLSGVDRAYLDGTFFADGEVPGRAMADIPHPFIEETLGLLAALPAEEREKVRFIHLNHSNPAHQPESPAARRIRAAGMDVARQGERFPL